MDIKITVEASELTNALIAIANSLNSLGQAKIKTTRKKRVKEESSSSEETLAKNKVSEEKPQLKQEKKVFDPFAKKSVPEPVTMNAKPFTLPTVSSPKYTREQLAKAAVIGLIDNGRMEEAQEILKSFSIESVSQLPEDKIDDFAKALISKGVKI